MKAANIIVLAVFLGMSILPSSPVKTHEAKALTSMQAPSTNCPQEAGALLEGAAANLDQAAFSLQYPDCPYPIKKTPVCKNGTIEGAAGVTCTGAGTYEIPIEVPPGSADMQPALSLTYNSQAGNGLLGMGWSISGLSTITRCAANMALDGYKGGINYDENDKFCMDGQRLVPIPNPNLPPGVVEYRTEPDTFTRVKSYGTTPTGADYFTAEAKSGLITEYGKTADSKIEAVVEGVGPTSDVRVWAANKLINRVGSYIEYSYIDNSAIIGGQYSTGEYYPREIRYTGNANTVPKTVPYNSVQFLYRGIRTDVTPFYQGGSFVKEEHRLDGFITYTGSVSVNRYLLQYQQGIATGRSQLTSVTKCNGDLTNCLPATMMTWSDQGVASLGGSPSSQWATGFGGNDGSFMKTRTPLYADAFFPAINAAMNAPDTTAAVFYGYSLGVSIVTFVANPIAGVATWIVGGIITFLNWYNNAYKIPKALLGDVNGDGRTDVVGFTDSKKDPDTEYVFLSNGKNAFNPQTSWSTWKNNPPCPNSSNNPPCPINDADKVKLGDFNGDGISDILSFETVTPNADGVVYFSNGTGSFSYSNMTAGNVGLISQSLLGDFNGDGKADIATFGNGHIHLNEGGGLISHSTWVSCGRCFNDTDPIEKVLFGDINGDGKTDAVHFNSDATTHAEIWLTNKTADGWTTAQTSGPAADYDFGFLINPIDPYSSPEPDVVLPGDFNGDGKMDVAVFRFEPQSSTALYDTNGDGVIDKKDVDTRAAHLSVYFSNGRTFVEQPAFNEILGNTVPTDAPFALGYPKDTLNPLDTPMVSFLSRLADFNGDGKTDLITFDATDSSHMAHLRLSDGLTFRPSISWATGLGLIDEDNIGDFNGDGRADILQFAGDPYKGQLYVTLSNSYPFPDLMTRVTDGLGKKDEFEYKPLTDDSVYKGHTSLTGLDAETYNFRGPLYVVSKHQTSNGIGGMYRQDYTYSGAKSHRSYGFLGFAKIIINDLQTSTYETIEYEQKYPLICRIKSRSTSQSTAFASPFAMPQSSQLSTQTMTWSYSATVPHKIKLDSETDIQYELDGATLSNTRTNYLYDVYNNVTQQATSWPDVGVNVETIASTYFNNQTTWMLGLPTSTTVTRLQPVAVPPRTVNRVFDTTRGLLTMSTEMLQGGKTRRTDYLNYDAFGNPWRVMVSGTDIGTRVTDIIYEAKGRFTTNIRNTLGQSTATYFGSEFGQMMGITDPNILTTTWQYDSFGREIKETRPDSTTTLTSYCPSTEGLYKPTYGVQWIQNKTSGVPDQTTFIDERGRVVRTAMIGFDGRRVYKDSDYDSALRIKKVSQPFYQNELRSDTNLEYDIRSRVKKETAPNGALINYTYVGDVALGPNPSFPSLTSRLLWHQVTAQNDLGEKTDYIVNRLNQVNRVAYHDSAGAPISHMTFNYDGFDNPLGIADENNNITRRTYRDDQMVSMADPDMGNSTYTYDVLGNLRSMTDAKANTVIFGYDLLDRLRVRLEPEGQSTWTYGMTAPTIGRLVQTSGGPTGFLEGYQYDPFGRLFRTNTVIPGNQTPLVTERTYDPQSRLATLKYPGPDNFTVSNVYNTRGYLSEVRQNNVTGPLFWQANSLNAAGQLTAQTQGNTVGSTFAYDTMHNITDIKHGATVGGLFMLSPLKRTTYAYDQINNLTERRNLIRIGNPKPKNQDYIDQFGYDGLHRLTRSFNSMDDNILKESFPGEDRSLSYDTIGNITHKSDFGAPTPNYTYPSTGQGPHAVSQVTDSTTGHPYTYDVNGNMQTSYDFQNGQNRTLNWYSYNKQSNISEPGKSLSLTYDTYRDKIIQVYSGPGSIKRTEYVGGLMEKVVQAPGPTEHTYYIYGSSPNPVAMFTTRSAGASDVRYLHYDNLGSLDLITNETGGIEEDLSYDAHGVRRNADWTATPTIVPSLTAHGFTNQEHLDEFGLIDMKGRMYDPKIGRFISADPYITDPFFTENLSRYSYVYNSPTNFIDPSGFQELPGSGFVPVFGAIDYTLQEVVITATIDTVAMPTSFVTSLAQSLAISGGISMETVNRLSNATSMTPVQSTGQSSQNYIAAAVTTGVAQKPIVEPLTPAQKWNIGLQRWINYEKTHPQTVMSQTQANLENLVVSGDPMEAITGKTGLNLLKANQRGASWSEKLGIVLEGLSEASWKVLGAMKGVGGTRLPSKSGPLYPIESTR